MPGAPLTRASVPLWERHVARLRAAHTHFAGRDGDTAWGTWPGEEALWRATESVLARRDAEEGERGGDWRVRILIWPRGVVEVQALPAPASIGAFELGAVAAGM